jgi:hypothetical protein
VAKPDDILPHLGKIVSHRAVERSSGQSELEIEMNTNVAHGVQPVRRGTGRGPRYLI